MGKIKYLECDLIGKTFNYLTIIREVKRVGRYVRMMKAKCVCGVIKNYPMQVILRGDTKSCGCKMVELRNPSVIKHGLSGHPLSGVHYTIKQRCYNKNNKSYKNYGAKGVEMCEEWLNNFMSFYDWCIENGWEKGLQIDKDIKYNAKHGTKVGKIYSPEYCSIVTPKQNSQVRSNSTYLTFNGKTKNILEWAEQYGISSYTLWQRIDRGWDIEKALTTPSDEYHKHRKKYLACR